MDTYWKLYGAGLKATHHSLHCDAGFSWTKQPNPDSVVGEICVWISGWICREKVAVPRHSQLRQYNNVYELLAIARAVEIATERGYKNVTISSDSQVAVAWSRRGIAPIFMTPAHRMTLDRLLLAKKGYRGVIKIKQIPRERNYAGHELERRNGRKYGYYTHPACHSTDLVLQLFPTGVGMNRPRLPTRSDYAADRD